ncbi:MAG: hypothetical protein AB8H79_02735 [Myxococcota bacterium]
MSDKEDHSNLVVIAPPRNARYARRKARAVEDLDAMVRSTTAVPPPARKVASGG